MRSKKFSRKNPLVPIQYSFEGFTFRRRKISNDRYIIEVFSGTNRIYATKPLGKESSEVIFLSDKFKNRIVNELRSEYKKTAGRIKNPPATTGIVIGKSTPIDTGPLGMPQDPDEAYALGRLAGIKHGLYLCEKQRIITKWWERGKLRKKITEEFDKWAESIDRLFVERKRGAKVAIPVVRSQMQK